MKNALLAAIAVASVLTATGQAEAAQGCGPGGHRGPAGYCRPNGPYFAPGVRVGVFYPGRGYWDGHHYWAHREWYRHGWRYHP